MSSAYLKRLEKLQNEIRKRGLVAKARNHLMDADELERIIAEDKAQEVEA
jgi:hypothetical protein